MIYKAYMVSEKAQRWSQEVTAIGMEVAARGQPEQILTGLGDDVIALLERLFPDVPIIRDSRGAMRRQMLFGFTVMPNWNKEIADDELETGRVHKRRSRRSQKDQEPAEIVRPET